MVSGRRDTEQMNLKDVAHELYALGLKEFTKTRNERAAEARDTGDRELAQDIKALKKPAKAAWVLNMLARRHSAEIEQFLSVGERLRIAQENLDGDQLRELDRKRRQLTNAVTVQGKKLAKSLGEPISDTVASEVEETLRAAMADPGGAAALASGLLIDTFDSSGLEPVNLTDVVAVPSAVKLPTRKEAKDRTAESGKDDRAREEAKRKLKEAEDFLSQAEQEADKAHQEAARAERRREDLRKDRQELQERLKDLEKDLAAAEADAKNAKHDEERAQQKREEARADAEKAKAEVERLS